MPKLGKITVMIDYFVDRFVRINNLNELISLMKKKSSAGGGSVRGINQTEVKGGNAVNIGYALGVFRANVNLVAIANSLPTEMLTLLLASSAMSICKLLKERQVTPLRSSSKRKVVTSTS